MCAKPWIDQNFDFVQTQLQSETRICGGITTTCQDATWKTTIRLIQEGMMKSYSSSFGIYAASPLMLAYNTAKSNIF